MSGSQLALDILAEGAARKSPLYAAQLTRLALRLLSSPVHAVGRLLADVCTKDTLNIYLDELERLIGDVDKSACIEAWACLTRLVDLGFVPVDKWYIYIRSTPQLVEKPDLYWTAAASVDTNIVLLTELASRLYSMPAEGIRIRRQITTTTQEPEVLRRTELWPPALNDAATFISSRVARKFTVRLANQNFAIQLYSCRPRSDTNYTALPLDEKSDASWMLTNAAMAYSFSGTADALASLVDRAKEIFNSEMYPSPLTVNLPWPAVACLQSAAENGSHDIIADALRTGMMGSLEEWQEWEDNWTRNGLDWESIPTGHGILPFVKDHWLAAPAVAAYNYVNYGRLSAEAVWRTVERHISVAESSDNPAGRRALVALASIPAGWHRGHERHSEGWKVPFSADRVTLLRRVLKVVGLPQGSEYIKSLIATISFKGEHVSTEGADQLIHLINDIFVNETYLDPADFDDDSISAFRLAIAEDPSLTGLLVPLAARATMHELPFAPFDVATHRKRMPIDLLPQVEFLLQLIDVRQRGLDVDDVELVVKLSEQLPRTYLMDLFSALYAFSPGADAELVLVALYRELQRSGSEQALKTAVLEELSARMRRRKTQLSNGDEWERLGLPRRVIEICR